MSSSTESESKKKKEEEESPVKVTVGGGVNVDLFYSVTSFPSAGETVMGKPIGDRRLGGKGANTAVAASQMGAQSLFLGIFGDDSDSAWLKTKLIDGFGVDCSISHSLSDTAAGRAFIFLLPNGENSIVVINDLSERWNNKDDSDLSKDQIQAIIECDVLLLQREIESSMNLRMARVAAKHGTPIILDIGGSEDNVSKELLRLCDVVSPNVTEIKRLMIDDEDSSIIAIESLSQKELKARITALNDRYNVRTLMKLGSRGCCWIGKSGEDSIEVSALDVPEERIVDTAGAGDCFTGAFAVEWLRLQKNKKDRRNDNDKLRSAMRFACVSAGLSIQKHGCSASIPTLEMVRSLL